MGPIKSIQTTKAMKTYLLLPAAMLFLFVSCKKDDSPKTTIGGDQSPIGEVGNTFGMSTVDGISNPNAKITELTDGVSKIEYTCQIDDEGFLEMAKFIPGTTINGKMATGGGKAKITSEGIMNVYDEGNLILVDYEGSVGDTYSLKRGGKTITRKITEKSTTDDYFWGFMQIKTMATEETGRGIPGVTKVEYRTNHKFGLVGIKAYFEDGTTKDLKVFSTNSN